MPLVLNIKNMQPAYMVSAAHLEPSFMYKGEVCTGTFVFFLESQWVHEGKARLYAVNNCWEDQQGRS